MRALVIIFSLLLMKPALADMYTDIKNQGSVSCSTNFDVFGISMFSKEKNQFEGISVDLCRAIAKAVFGDSSKARIYPTQSKDRIPFTASGNYNVLIATVEWTAYRERFLGIQFTNPWLYDNQQIAVRKSLNVKKPEDLNGLTICLVQGNNAEVAISDLTRERGIAIKPLTFADSAMAISTFDQGRCDGYSTDSYLMSSQLSKVMKNLDDVTLIDLDFNFKVFGVAVKRGEDDWASVVYWVINTLIWAEELGITKDNVEDMAKNSKKADVRRVLNLEGGFGKRLGLKDDWAIEMIKEFGNYGELFDKNFTNNPYVKFPPRTANKLCRNGGKICPVPIF